MTLEKIEKISNGKFISRYDLTYRVCDGTLKVYEMISSDGNIKTEADLISHPVDAVVLIMEDIGGERILLCREFRLATGEFVYNFPAGFIDEGETPTDAAKRELKEETGLDIIEINDIIGESYTAVGLSNVKDVCIVGKAGGSFSPSTSAVEEIEAKWYTKGEVRKLLKSKPFAARTQAYCYMWSK